MAGAPPTIKLPNPDSNNDDHNIDGQRIFSFYAGKEQIYITKIEAINLINTLSGQLYAYELART